MVDKEILQKEHSDIMRKLHEADSRDYKTKKELVSQLIDISRKMVGLELIDGVRLTDLASYINGRLDEFGIKYPRNQDFYNLFSEKEKREYGTNNNSTSRRNHEHNFQLGNNNMKKCECGVVQFYGINYEKKIEEVEDDFEDNFPSFNMPAKTEKKIEPQPDPYENPVTQYLSRIHYNAQDLAELCDDLIKKYYSSKDVAKTIEGAMNFKLDKLIDEQKSLEAKLIHMKKQSDFRQKIGEFEKIKAIILEKSTYNVAKVAKMLSITPKHMTNNIIRNLDEFKRHMNWFRTVFIKCNKCKTMIDFNMAEWYNEQIIRKDLDIELRQPINT